MAVPIPPLDLAGLCRCSRCGRLFIPDHFNSFGSGVVFEDGRWQAGYGTCDDCYPEPSPFRAMATGLSPAQQRAADALAPYR